MFGENADWWAKKSPHSVISNGFTWIMPIDGIEKQEKPQQNVSATVAVDNTVATDKKRI